jgi:putative transposase
VAIAAAARPTGEPPQRPPRRSHLKSGPRLRCVTDNSVLRRPLESGQFVSLAFGQQARAAGIAQSMGSKGDCFDNAVAESFFATLKKELIHGCSWPTKAGLRTEVFEYIEVFFNRRRRHSTLGFLSPAQFETTRQRELEKIELAATVAAQKPRVHRTGGTPSATPSVSTRRSSAPARSGRSRLSPRSPSPSTPTWSTRGRPCTWPRSRPARSVSTRSSTTATSPPASDATNCPR